MRKAPKVWVPEPPAQLAPLLLCAIWVVVLFRSLIALVWPAAN